MTSIHNHAYIGCMCIGCIGCMCIVNVHISCMCIGNVCIGCMYMRPCMQYILFFISRTPRSSRRTSAILAAATTNIAKDLTGKACE